MSQPFIGEIRLFGGGFAPAGWAFCHGQLLAIAQNDALFALIGTIYGGDGQNTFGLPDLRGRTAVHQGQGPGLQPYTIGEAYGVENVTLLGTQIPAHTHGVVASAGPGATANPSNAVWAAGSGIAPYNTVAPGVVMQATSISNSGGSQAHQNMTPFLALNYIISLFGIFPSRN